MEPTSLFVMWIGIGVVIWLLSQGRRKLKLTSERLITYLVIAVIVTIALIATIENWPPPNGPRPF